MLHTSALKTFARILARFGFHGAQTIKLAVVLDSVVKLQVILESDTGMAASAHVFGVPAPHFSTDLEHEVKYLSS